MIGQATFKMTCCKRSSDRPIEDGMVTSGRCDCVESKCGCLTIIRQRASLERRREREREKRKERSSNEADQVMGCYCRECRRRGCRETEMNDNYRMSIVSDLITLWSWSLKRTSPAVPAAVNHAKLKPSSYQLIVSPRLCTSSSSSRHDHILSLRHSNA